jgi:hypothetical protein
MAILENCQLVIYESVIILIRIHLYWIGQQMYFLNVFEYTCMVAKVQLSVCIKDLL